VNLSTRAKVLLAIALTFGLLAWVILLDFGINAGRIHYGVHVRGTTVGGMTIEEAMVVLQERGEELRFEPVVLSAEGMNCSFIPDDVGWGPKPKSTAETARDIGFTGGLFEALGDRATAWFNGVRVEWVDTPNVRKVTSLIDDCEGQAEALNLELDRYKLRRLMRRAIVTWPRRIFQVPVDPA
jgi:hypothetical protein